jgi:hydroxymethylglutaryl-CoA reductase
MEFKSSYATNKSVVNSLAAGANEINLFFLNDWTGIFAEVGQEFPLIKGTIF